MHTTLSTATTTLRSRPKTQRGFTLIELMIGVSVAGILSSIALPSFEGQLQRARRADVLVSMMSIQMAQERFRSNSTRYGTLVDIGVPNLSPSKHYTLQANAVGTDGYDALATASGLQARDATCRYMKLSAAGGYLSYASGPDDTVTNPADVTRKCWNL